MSASVIPVSEVSLQNVNGLVEFEYKTRKGLVRDMKCWAMASKYDVSKLAIKPVAIDGFVKPKDQKYFAIELSQIVSDVTVRWSKK